MLPELISKVYVINLKSSTDRRKHIKKIIYTYII